MPFCSKVVLCYCIENKGDRNFNMERLQEQRRVWVISPTVGLNISMDPIE
jgi:hypothetical protein